MNLFTDVWNISFLLGTVNLNTKRFHIFKKSQTINNVYNMPLSSPWNITSPIPVFCVLKYYISNFRLLSSEILQHKVSFSSNKLQGKDSFNFKVSLG